MYQNHAGRPTPPLGPWRVSARGPDALHAQAAQLLAHTAGADDAAGTGEGAPVAPVAPITEVGHALATTRAALPDRAVVLGGDRAALHDGLRALAAGAEAPLVVRGTAHPDPRLAFLFTGQGAQRAGMGRELYAAFPVFAEAFDAACAELDRAYDRPVREVVFEDQALLDRTEYTQAGLFALEVALYRLARSWGLRPDFLLGHSVGELVAAHVSGMLTLPDAAALVAARGRLMQALPEGGAMLSVRAAEDVVRPLLLPGVDIAAVNGPESVVVSGDRDAVDGIGAALAAAGHRTKQLNVSHAFHSPLMEPMLDTFRRVVSRLTFRAPDIPIVSNVTGRIATAGELSSPDYWVRHVRATVRFHDGIRTLADHGVNAYLELGPDGVLTAMGQACFPDAPDAADAPGSTGAAGATGPRWSAALRRDQPETTTFGRAMAEAFVHGVAVEWSSVFPGAVGGVELPTYAFQRERFWLGGVRG
ncbi:acyltransferase domain-containing protein, partial [Streptomyces bambusae]|uniref:acyltransferase domain-containing protein n=1 Tax=Streptomyces bambusae TaxID=1550616 RepID=UPI0027E0133C